MDGVTGEPGDEEQEDDEPDYRLPRTGRIAVWGNARGPNARTAGSGLPTYLQRAEPLSRGNILRDTTFGRPAPTRASKPMMPCCPRQLTGSGA
eukprot:4277434-Lingulodinium_polyedra.AAC.1